MVIQLMRYGADPCIADGEGYRALHLAILFQHMAIAAYLMAKGQVCCTKSVFLVVVFCFFLLGLNYIYFFLGGKYYLYHFFVLFSSFLSSGS